MTPNAISDAGRAQTDQLKKMRSDIQGKIVVIDNTLSHLHSAVKEIDSMGTIPSLTDVSKIARAIRFLALALIVSNQSNKESLAKDVVTLDTALEHADSPIVRPTRIG